MLKPFFKKFIKPISQDQKGATLLIAALILALLTVFVSTALINTSSSGISINNDARTKNSFYVSYAALEKMSKEFSDVFTANLSPTPTQLNTIKANAEALANSTNPAVRIVSGMNLKTDIRKGNFASTGITLTNGPYSGLKTLREEYVFTATSTTNSGVTVQLSRSLYNNLIPIFQFGIFSTRHLEFFNGPAFNFGGRVHSNKDIYLGSTGQTRFADRVTTVGQIVYGKQRNGTDRSGLNIQVFYPPTNSYRPLTLGSVTNGPDIAGDPRPGHPAGTTNKAAFDTFIQTFLPGQVFFKAPVLKLPVQNTGNRPIEIIRRGLPGENPATDILAQSRFYNKAGLRITLSDTQAQLPGGNGGVQLDSPVDDNSVTYADGRLGYKPQALGTYQASRINGHRIKGWIKIQTLQRQADGTLVETDVTKAILALGVTKYDQPFTAPATPPDKTDVNAIGTLNVTNFPIPTAYGTLNDTNSIFCLQRYSLVSTGTIGRSDGGVAGGGFTGPGITTLSNAGKNNLVVATGVASETINTPLASAVFPLVDNLNNDPRNSDTPPIIYVGGGGTGKTKLLAPGMIIPFPINMYDHRENPLDVDPNGSTADANIRLSGVMSLIDINMQNLKKLLTGGFDTAFAAATPSIAFRAKDISSESNGWIIYISDRRGDTFNADVADVFNQSVTTGMNPTVDLIRKDNLGKYDVESVYGGPSSVTGNPRKGYIPSSSTQTLFEMEDINDNGVIEYPGLLNYPEGALPDEDIDRIDAITKGPWHGNAKHPAPTTAAIIGATRASIFSSSGTGYTRIRLDNPAPPLPTSPPAGTVITEPLFRRAVRLSNAADLTRPAETVNDKALNLNRGITIACENAVYLLGNYNTTGTKFPNTSVTTPNTAADFDYVGTTLITPSKEVPASIISDSITFLSNAWTDANSFVNAYTVNSRVATNTQYRFAAFTGRVRDGLFVGANDTPKWGVIGTSGSIGPEPDDVRLYGGVHNFLKYLEKWDTSRLSYCGSIIDGWDSFQTNGNYKCCATVYKPPLRDYTFNTAFQSVDRLPPGTPNLQYILFTNFRENVNPKQF